MASPTQWNEFGQTLEDSEGQGTLVLQSMRWQSHTWPSKWTKTTTKMTENSSLNRKEERICGRGRIPLVKTLAKIWKQTKCSSTDKWIKKQYCIQNCTHTHTHTHTHTLGYYSVTKKNENLLFAAIWMDLWGIFLSKISQIRERERQILCNIICMWNLKM